MSDVLTPDAEQSRLATLRRYHLDDIAREPGFDRIARLTARLLDAPIATVSVIGEEVQCLRGAIGADFLVMPRSSAFCSTTILGSDMLVVSDLSQDARFRANALVTGDAHIRFYAGMPLRLGDGHAVGALCVMDRAPRAFGAAERDALAEAAEAVVDLMELRLDRGAAEAHRHALAAERELLEVTVDNVAEGVALFERDHGLSVCNEAFGRLLGTLPEPVGRGMSVGRLIELMAARGDFGAGEVAATRARLVASIRDTASNRVEIERGDGIILDAHRRTLADGRFVVTLRDVTQERQTARLKDELVSTVSHELRTPLTAISGALGLLDGGAAGALSPQAANLVAIGRKNAERLRMLVDDLLTMDKLQSGAAEFRFVPVDLAAFLREAVEQNQPYADRFGVAIALDLPDRAVGVVADAARLFQVVANLVSNAAKFSPRGGTVHVSLRADAAAACIRVRDEGPGVAPAFRDRLFQRFAQDEAQPHGHAGQASTGLGLAISKAIVDAHRGTIALESRGGPGASFAVCLPWHRDDDD